MLVTVGFVAGKGDFVAIGAGTLTDWGLGHLVGAALLGAIGVVVGSLVRSQLAAMIGISCSRVPIGASSFGPGRDVG
jgi:hypothetical protein